MTGLSDKSFPAIWVMVHLVSRVGLIVFSNVGLILFSNGSNERQKRSRRRRFKRGRPRSMASDAEAPPATTGVVITVE